MSTSDTSERQISPALLIVLGVAVLAAIGFAVVSFAGGSDDVAAGGDPGSAAPSEQVAQAPIDDASEGSSEIIEEDGVQPSFQVFDARDPFDQLAADDDGGAGAADGTVDSTQPASATTPTDDGSVPDDGSQPDGTIPDTDDPQGPSQTTVGSTTILLDDVFTSAAGEETALVVVDDEGFEATEGDTVAGKVTVLDIAGNCATMRYEDKRFILCEGEQITK